VTRLTFKQICRKNNGAQQDLNSQMEQNMEDKAETFLYILAGLIIAPDVIMQQPLEAPERSATH
jgi:hypothetical protein